MTAGTLRLLLDLLNRQQLAVSAPRSDIDAVLNAKDELEAAIAQADPSGT